MNIHDQQNSFCEFIDIGLDMYQCSKCGSVISSYDGTPMMMCSAVNEAEIIQLERTGLGCSLAQVEERFSICSSCEWFQNNSCTKCGCRIVRNREFKNKLLWKNEHCPLNKW